MRITMKEKLKMCKLHLEDGFSLSHISELYGNYNVGNIKYAINFYKTYGKSLYLQSIILTKKMKNVKISKKVATKT